MINAKILAAALAVSTVTVAAAPAQAATPFDFSQDFGQGSIPKGPFSYTYSFDVKTDGTSDVNISYLLKATGITSLQAMFNNAPIQFDKVSSSGYYGETSASVNKGTQTITVTGVSNGKLASFSGNFYFSSAVPEPASWAFMMLGLGAAGTMLRRRGGRKTVSVTYA